MLVENKGNDWQAIYDELNASVDYYYVEGDNSNLV